MVANKNEDCQVCKYIRWYFMIGVPIVFFTWMQPDLYFLKGLDLGNIFATAVMIGLILVGISILPGIKNIPMAAVQWGL